MNYLAHFHLAGDNEGLIVGAFLGDFVKGPLTAERITALNLSDQVVRGIKLHRSIDAYVDHLPALVTLGNQLPLSLRRYKGIYLDLFCDYALSHYWPQFDKRPLDGFIHSLSAPLAKHQHRFNPAAAYFYGRMLEYKLLNNYGDKVLINRIIERIGQRLNRPQLNISELLAEGCQSMWDLESQWLAGFGDIYRDILAFASEQRRGLELDA